MKLLSKNEAKLAWANGEVVQIRNTIVGEDFYNIDEKGTTLNVFSLDFYEFRLKPRTITINGIEVPAPFEPESGERFYYVYAGCSKGYTLAEKINSNCIVDQFGAWRTEEEIKQVVEALRSVFKPL